jgi:hypothetical protein
MVHPKAKPGEVGDTVYAKWPGSRKYYEAVIKEYLDSDDQLLRVHFKEGSLTAVVDARDVFVSIWFVFSGY